MENGPKMVTVNNPIVSFDVKHSKFFFFLLSFLSYFFVIFHIHQENMKLLKFYLIYLNPLG